MGEPLGDGATRLKPGGGRAREMGFGGSSSSSSNANQYQTSNLNDNRQVFDNRVDDHSITDNSSRWLDQSISNSGNTTTNTDNRITDNSSRYQSNTTTAEDSYNTSNSGNTNTTTTTNITQTLSDSGAVMAGQNIAISALNNNASNIDHILNLGDVLFSKAKGSLDANTALAGQLAGTASKAYADATAQASGSKYLVLAGLGILGLVAWSIYKKRG